jgi:hypothetical protein
MINPFQSVAEPQRSEELASIRAKTADPAGNWWWN